MKVHLVTNHLNGQIRIDAELAFTQHQQVLETWTLQEREDVRAGRLDPLPLARQMDRMAEDLRQMLEHLGHQVVLEHLT